MSSLRDEIDYAEIDPPPSPRRVAPAALDAFARAQDTALPQRYAEFMERFGPGIYFGEIEIYSIDEATRVTDDLRRADHFAPTSDLWENTSAVLSPEDARHLVILGHTLNGDWLAFVAGHPERLLKFPRDGSRIVDVGPTFASALAAVLPADE